MKKFFTILLSLVLAMPMAACGNGELPENSVQKTAVKKEVVKAIKTGSLEELNALVLKDVTDSVAALRSEYEKLSTDIDAYDKYKNNINSIEDFYNKTQSDIQMLCIRLREYSYSYAELILSSDKSFDDMYEDFDEMYDSIYEDARDEIYDEIYDGILDDIYDAFYDGVLEDAYDLVPYKEWSDTRSDAYDIWSDTRSEIYDIWSDVGSDVYDFWSDMRGEIWDKDIEKAREKMQDFKDDIEKLYEKANTYQESTKKATAVQQTTAAANNTEGTQWKQFLEEYEVWVNKSLELEEKYKQNPNDTDIWAEYTEMLKEVGDWQEKAKQIKDDLEKSSPEEVAKYSAELLKILAKSSEQ